MKYLTPIYLTLMHAFKDQAFSRSNNPNFCYDPISDIRDNRTLRLDGGRQSGKTTAITEFASDWLNDGGSVIIISNKQSYAKITHAAISDKFFSNRNHNYNKQEFNNHCFVETVRSFIDNGGYQCRGRTLNRILYIIDEPIRLPDINKFYEAHFKGPHCSSFKNTNELPLFFVIGTQ
ncbi:hypothetical protein ACQ31_gp182 [Salmonella phage STML-198]|nr:hypothetical protein ACQ31_gp182 [Salmonella phage STML-198]AFU64065.1 hypothetical protein [Salmonella phage STML-198]UPW42485.1 hypothetical protein EBPHNEJP_00187 [Salmonella phage CF-SP2]